MVPSPPDFCAHVDRALAAAAGQVRLLAAVAPREAEAERARLIAALETRRDAIPRWTYARAFHHQLASELEAAAVHLDALAEDEPLAHVYSRRAAEIALEARLAESAGTTVFGHLARQRFDETRADAARAYEIARAWIALPTSAPAGPPRTTDGPEPESLISRMRDAIGQARAPFGVEVRRDLASLAATGERTVFVAAARVVDDEDVRRTVIHETLAHVMPRTRAARLVPKIFQLGTAHGADEQEGLAILIEERHGVLSPRRKRELAARHLAVLAMDDGASFFECVRALVHDRGLTPRDAVLVAERAYRGGNGSSPGLGRERVYLASYARVRAHLDDEPEDERVLSSGQVAVDAIELLRPFVPA